MMLPTTITAMTMSFSMEAAFWLFLCLPTAAGSWIAPHYLVGGGFELPPGPAMLSRMPVSAWMFFIL